MLIAQACACYQEEQFYFLWDGMLPDTVGQWGFKKSSSQQWQRNNYKPEKDKVVHMCTDTCIFCIKAINKINILNWLEFPIPVVSSGYSFSYLSLLLYYWTDHLQLYWYIVQGPLPHYTGRRMFYWQKNVLCTPKIYNINQSRQYKYFLWDWVTVLMANLILFSSWLGNTFIQKKNISKSICIVWPITINLFTLQTSIMHLSRGW